MQLKYAATFQMTKQRLVPTCHFQIKQTLRLTILIYQTSSKFHTKSHNLPNHKMILRPLSTHTHIQSHRQSHKPQNSTLQKVQEFSAEHMSPI
jgi:hypothetical protein